LLPRIGDEFLATVVERIEEAAAVFGLEGMRIRHRRILESDPHQVAALLSRISAEELDGLAIMAPESPQVRDAITRLKERGVQVVQFVAGQHDAGPSDFVGFDNRAAGATAGRLIGRFCRGEAGKVLVVSERMSSLDSVERRLGFDAILTADYPELSTLPSLETYGDTERTRNVVHTSFQSHADIVAVYILSSEPRAALTAIAEATDPAKQVILAHERTRFTEQMLLEGRLDAVIAQNPGHLVRSAIRILRARADGREPLASQETIRIEIILKENLIQ
jgi:LacI family transcriptional regulator